MKFKASESKLSTNFKCLTLFCCALRVKINSEGFYDKPEKHKISHLTLQIQTACKEAPFSVIQLALEEVSECTITLTYNSLHSSHCLFAHVS